MALTTAQQALLLFKKWLGLGQTTASREFFNETAYPGRVAVYTNQIWTQADLIPNTAPVLSSGQTSGVVQYWQNAPLGAVPGTTNAFTSSLLIDAIPFNYGDGSSYNYVLRNSGGTVIAFGDGDWIVDTDAGLVTFYSTVPANMPPTISFYKYVGTKGFTSGSVPLTGSLFGTASFAISASWAPLAAGIISSSNGNFSGTFSGSLTGSLFGTSSWANNAISSSFATTASTATSITFIPATASFAATASYVPSLVLPEGIVSSSSQINTGSFTGSFDGLFTGQVIGTSSWAVNAITASYVESLVLPNDIVTASSQIDHNLTTNYVADQHIDHTVVSIIAGDGLVGGGNISASRTLTLDTGSLHFLNAIKNKLNIEGVISSSTQFQDNLFNIDTYEFVTDGVQNTFNLTKQYDSSSLIVTVDGLAFSPIDDYTVSSTNIVFTSPLVSESLILVRAFVNVSDAVGTFTGSLLGTASYATNALSASWAPGGGGGGGGITSITVGAGLTGGTITTTGTITLDTGSTHFITGSISASQLQGLFSSSTQVDYSSIQNKPTTISTASYVDYTNVVNKPTLVSSSQQINTGSFSGSITTASFATTASYVLSNGLPIDLVSSSIQTVANIAGQTIIPNIITASAITTTNLIVLGTSSITNVSSSELNIGTNLITVNTANPVFRFGGLAVLDSGSSPLQSASILYDSLQDEWIFVHKGSAVGSVTSSHFMMGPETYGALGDEVYIPTNQLVRSVGNEHVTGSNITDTGILVTINSNADITGSLRLNTGTFIGDLTGTASWASNVISSSLATTASAATSITFIPTSASFAATSSFAVSASWAPGGSAIAVLDEGSQLTSTVTSLNFVGTGVSASNVGDAVTITVSGGGGGVTFAEVLKAVSLRI